MFTLDAAPVPQGEREAEVLRHLKRAIESADEYSATYRNSMPGASAIGVAKAEAYRQVLAWLAPSESEKA